MTTISTPNGIDLDQDAVEQFIRTQPRIADDYLMPEGDDDGEPWSYEQCEDDNAAEQHLRCIRYWQKKAAEFDAHADAEIERINAWRESRKKSPEWQQQFHRRCLENWFADDERKTAKLINGTIKQFKGRERVEIIDADAVPEKYLAETVSTRPDKKLILDAIKSTGEIPAGCDLVRGEDSIKIEVSHG